MRLSVKYWTCIILGFVVMSLIGGYGVYWAFYMREHRRWEEDLKLWNGGGLHAQLHISRKVIDGHGDLWWMPGDWRFDEVRFAFDGKQYRWESSHVPIAVQPDADGSVYIVAYDRESEDSTQRFGPLFRIYRSRNGDSWKEVAPETFPRHLAIQNRACAKFTSGGPNDPSNILPVIERMDPTELEFRLSLNGKLWGFLEDPSDKTGMATDPSSSVLAQFKEEWIRPIGPAQQSSTSEANAMVPTIRQSSQDVDGDP